MKKYQIFKIDIGKVNIFLLGLLLVLTLFLYFVFPDMLFSMYALFDNTKYLLMIVPMVILWSMLHELLHALGYIINGANPKKITFGIEFEKGVFYCLCKSEITKRNILISLMYPLFFIGIVTGVIAIIYKLPFLLLLSYFNICGAAGDILYFIFIVRLDKDTCFSEMDDGTSFALITKKDLSKMKPFGLTYVDTVNSIPRKDFKRIKISKASIPFLILGVLLIVIALFM